MCMMSFRGFFHKREPDGLVDLQAVDWLEQNATHYVEMWSEFDDDFPSRQCLVSTDSRWRIDPETSAWDYLGMSRVRVDYWSAELLGD